MWNTTFSMRPQPKHKFTKQQTHQIVLKWSKCPLACPFFSSVVHLAGWFRFVAKFDLRGFSQLNEDSHRIGFGTLLGVSSCVCYTLSLSSRNNVFFLLSSFTHLRFSKHTLLLFLVFFFNISRWYVFRFRLILRKQAIKINQCLHTKKLSLTHFSSESKKKYMKTEPRE